MGRSPWGCRAPSSGKPRNPQPSATSAPCCGCGLLGLPHLDPAGAPSPNQNEPSKQCQEVQVPLRHPGPRRQVPSRQLPPRGLRG